jgi:hypothetical protein
MVKNNQIGKIERQISYLEARKHQLEGKRADKLMKMLTRCGADKLPVEVLAGSILEAVRSFNNEDKRITSWASEGMKILKPGRGRRKIS